MVQEPKHTYPDIDRCIKWLSIANKAAYGVEDCIDTIKGGLEPEQLDNLYRTFSLLQDYLSDIKNHTDFDGTLEDLRDANISLREWGHEMRKELESANNYIHELESRT